MVKSAKRSDAGPSISSVLELHTDWTGYRVLYTVDAEYSPTSALALPLRQQALLRLVLLQEILEGFSNQIVESPALASR